MKQSILSMVRMLVEHPGDVCLTQLNGATLTIFELRCHNSDIGKIIGKDGKTVGALRTLLSVMAARQGRKAVLEVVE